MTFLFDDDVPDDLSHLLNHVGHRVTFLRDVLPPDTQDAAVVPRGGFTREGLHDGSRPGPPPVPLAGRSGSMCSHARAAATSRQ